MKTPTKFVNKLGAEQREAFRQLMKTGNEQARRRAHAVLLNARGYSVDQIADIYIEIPAATSDRINVLAFFNTEHDFHPFVFEKISIKSEIVAACLDYLSLRITRLTLVVIDQASIHIGEEVESRREEWEERGLYIYLLPAYSPELNLIEILWRMIKYHWLPLNAYGSFKSLLRALIGVLKGIGSKYQIDFAH